MNIKKVDDPEFRKALISTFTERDNPRRFQIHFTDLIVCLCCSAMHKVLPEEATDERYDAILTWTRGLAFDSTITSRMSGKTAVEIDGTMGEIDMMFQDMPYELTSSVFISNRVKQSDDLDGKYQYKQQQLRFYMAAIGSTRGRLKIVEVAKSNSDTRYHTWEIEMTPLELARDRIILVNRKNILKHALRTGSLAQMERLSNIYCPILKDSRCIDPETSLCKNLRQQNWTESWKQWRLHPEAIRLLGGRN